MAKSILILIDGYNLLFQSPFVGKGRGPGWLEAARGRLIKFLCETLPEAHLARTQVVFDASRTGPLGQSRGEEDLSFVPIRSKRRGSQYEALPAKSGQTEKHARRKTEPTIVFASDYAEADDLIEETIRKHSHPKSLTVVSSDNRIRRCAKARRCISLDSEAFLEELQQPGGTAARSSELEPVDEEPPIEPSQAEVDFWLNEFGDERREDDGKA